MTVSCDKRDVSHSTGIRAVVFRVKEGTGGILACSEHGIIHQSNKKDYWIPSDRYCVTSSPDANAVLTDGLTSIRDEVLGNTFDPLRQSERPVDVKAVDVEVIVVAGRKKFRALAVVLVVVIADSLSTKKRRQIIRMMIACLN